MASDYRGGATQAPPLLVTIKFEKFFKKGFILHCKLLIIRSCFAATESTEKTEDTEGRGGAANEE